MLYRITINENIHIATIFFTKGRHDLIDNWIEVRPCSLPDLVCFNQITTIYFANLVGDLIPEKL